MIGVTMRVTLTKKEAASEAGTELLALCTTVTEDGSISDEEVEHLRSWLERNRSTPLPAISFLHATVNRIIADRVITEAERRELHLALERVLPKEIREAAVGVRRQVEIQHAEQEQRARPICSYDFMVAGVSYEGRGVIIRKHVKDDDVVFLLREPQNRYSRNAVQILLENGLQIGYVPEDFAREMAPQLDGGCKQHAYVKKVLGRGRSPIPVIVADLFGPDSESSDAYYPPSEFAACKRGSAASASAGGSIVQGCAGLVVIVLVFMAAIFLVFLLLLSR